ncbi:hypothetical protein KIN20_017866 [Parelaphostrongylus tenuis]|uniref:Uncharacterized protein n=1 Tax=Parelaphostrongylus tenuis TaxID=148309 RepID=A0AAD5QU20_PARTN|nr:hypothetical protein KIN20_017866 [Parelaphostrongylus tenuis]
MRNRTILLPIWDLPTEDLVILAFTFLFECFLEPHLEIHYARSPVEEEGVQDSTREYSAEPSLKKESASLTTASTAEIFMSTLPKHEELAADQPRPAALSLLWTRCVPGSNPLERSKIWCEIMRDYLVLVYAIHIEIFGRDPKRFKDFARRGNRK